MSNFPSCPVISSGHDCVLVISDVPLVSSGGRHRSDCCSMYHRYRPTRRAIPPSSTSNEDCAVVSDWPSGRNMLVARWRRDYCCDETIAQRDLLDDRMLNRNTIRPDGRRQGSLYNCPAQRSKRIVNVIKEKKSSAEGLDRVVRRKVIYRTEVI